MTKNKTDKINECHRKNTKVLPMRLHNVHDKDISDWLETKESKSGYIKSLIRADIQKQAE